jgi:hypothetical protein
MRALLVVALDEAIELLLLLKEVVSRRLRRLLLERQVHALVTALGPTAIRQTSSGRQKFPRLFPNLGLLSTDV